jgi:transcriptional regulator with XRE-family HTH domain
MVNFLREWRKHSGKTLVEVANVLGTTHTTILRYERGQMKVPVEVMNALADLYSCVPAELQFDPADREAGRRIHEALILINELDPEVAARWLEIGKLLKKPPET